MDTGMEGDGTDVVERFWVPRAWEKNAPRCVTRSVEGLIEFLEQVDEIIALAQIVDDQEMKQILTSYLPVGLRNVWRSMDAYGAGHSYTDFRHAIRWLYPEIAARECGSLTALDELCEEEDGIGMKEEGRLRRFGLKFCALVAKTPAFITNRDACQKYLNVLDQAFSSRLRRAVVDGKLLRLLARQAGVLPAHELEPYGRKDDPILLRELVELAEALASMDVEPGRTVNSTDVYRQNCQLESMQKGMDDFKDGVDAKLQAAFREIDAVWIEVRALQQHAQIAGGEVKDWRGHPVAPSFWPAPYPDTLAHFANILSTAGRGLLRGDDLRNERLQCYYCNQRGHFVDGCPTRTEHLVNHWILEQGSRGDIKLFDGKKIPRGRGSPAWRVSKLCRNANFDMQHSSTRVGTNKERQVNTLLNEVRGMRQEVAEMEKQDALLLNYWRSEWARRPDPKHAGHFEQERWNGDAEGFTAVEDEDAARWTQGRTVESERNGTVGRRPQEYWVIWVLGWDRTTKRSGGYLVVFIGCVLEHEKRWFEGRSAGLHKITYGDPSPEQTRSDGFLG
ncbi:hypothetical protein DFH06DRAFT_1302142 [Mycena polygramma]|nr:hypothetical protein DFH06DRAFT_1302142 [Mycena polygramma]